MPDTYHHGVRVQEINSGGRVIQTVATAIIGLVATASDADATTFPLNTPVLITDVATAIGKAGVDGTLAASLTAIADQAQAVTVVVRVAEGVDDAATTANVIGTTTADGHKTGLQALLSAQALLGVKPRIIGAPGLDTQAVVTALVTVAEKLRAMAYAGCDGCDTVAQAITYRGQFSARELMLLWPNFIRFDTATAANVEAPSAAYALGLRAAIDRDTGWHKTLSNVAVNGVVGITKPVFWDLQQEGTDADLLNQGCITTLVNHNGYRFWGSRTCDDEGLFFFESYTRTAQILADSIADAMFWAVDKPLHPSLAKDILESINAKLRGLKADGYILDGKAWLDESVNTSDTLKSGKLRIDYDYTPLPPLEDLTLRQRITDTYWADFAGRVAA